MRVGCVGWESGLGGEGLGTRARGEGWREFGRRPKLGCAQTQGRFVPEGNIFAKKTSTIILIVLFQNKAV